jgi:hypothetical protein
MKSNLVQNLFKGGLPTAQERFKSPASADVAPRNELPVTRP